MPLIEVESLCYAYGERQALSGVTFSITEGERFAFLGPNGGGKTTLFRLLSTLSPVRSGKARLLGYNLPEQSHLVRKHLGVVFQHPSLDLKLTVTENLRHHGHLYGLSGKELSCRIETTLNQMEIADRAKDRVETLSGGLRRRAELAKAILHKPVLLLLDEPSTGLDPSMRRSLKALLLQLQQQENVTIVLTTHLLDEAEACERVGILNEGKLVVVGKPDTLKASVGGDMVVIESPTPEQLGEKIRRQFGWKSTLVDQQLYIECQQGHEFVRDVVVAFPTEIQSVRVGRPTLEDVFITKTGRDFKEGKFSEEG